MSNRKFSAVTPNSKLTQGGEKTCLIVLCLMLHLNAELRSTESGRVPALFVSVREVSIFVWSLARTLELGQVSSGRGVPHPTRTNTSRLRSGRSARWKVLDLPQDLGGIYPADTLDTSLARRLESNIDGDDEDDDDEPR